MKKLRECESHADVFEGPYKRKIVHIVAPWTCGAKNVWLGTCTYPAGFKSNAHTHETQEEIFYCIAGSGQIKVNDAVYEVGVGDAVFVAPGETHQCLNLRGTEDFKLVSVVSPPFSKESFKKAHTPK